MVAADYGVCTRVVSCFRPPPSAIRLRLRGLPYFVTRHAVRDFFHEFNIVKGDNAIELLRDDRNRRSGHALVYFEDVMEAMRARDTLHRKAFCVQRGEVYRVDVLEDFPGRAVVVEEDLPGDITRERLRDETRKTQAFARYRETKNRKDMLKRSY
mmetsp:Transcript_65042/g.121162  ORF Transcript_65042/g.121162 Transcript_65042/m.121162 type:complete len:155 (-) Transcript_65042:43-507(-)